MYIRCLPCGVHVLQSRKLLRSHVSHPLTSETSGLTSVIPVMMLGLIELIINNSTTQWTCKNAGITLTQPCVKTSALQHCRESTTQSTLNNASLMVKLPGASPANRTRQSQDNVCYTESSYQLFLLKQRQMFVKFMAARLGHDLSSLRFVASGQLTHYFQTDAME